MEMQRTKKSIFKKLGWAGIGLCGLCCALPIFGALAGFGSLTAIALYLERMGIIVLGLTGVFFAYYVYKKKQAEKSCSTSCDVNCDCKLETAKDVEGSIHSKALIPSCNLSESALVDRKSYLQFGIVNRIAKVEELETGYDLIFHEPKEYAKELLAFINFERGCCSSFSYALIFEPNEKATHLQIFGSEKIKEELKRGYKALGLLK